jgi:pSer/pThr/pTyr-binding forkhead associated (FHA) protein
VDFEGNPLREAGGRVARLVFGEPPHLKTFLLNKPVVRIGRSPESDILLPDTGVSREHARIFQVGQDYFVEDLGSTNGTWVDGERIRQHRLKPGALVRVGPYEFRFAADAAR